MPKGLKDLELISAHQQLTPEQLDVARRNIASAARDDEEEAMFLQMLGLEP